MAWGQYYDIPDVNSEVQKQRDRIRNTAEELKEANRYTDYLDLGQTIEFPIGIRKELAGAEYVIAIDSIVFTPAYAILNASMLFKPPNSDEYIAFRGTDIRFTREGGISGMARLELVGDYLLSTPGSKVDLLLKGEDTFVQWDCDGFHSFQLGGGVVFSRDILIPIDDNLQPIMDARAMAEFSVNIGDWNDLIASANISPFQLPNLKDFSFLISEILIDFSDFRNPTGAIFPANYQSQYMVPGLPELWRGAYLNKLELILPPQFDDEKKKSRITASNLWIDEFGLSGDIHGEYILSLSDSGGTMSGWAFSLEEFDISLTANRLNHASFGGEVVLPIADSHSALRYDAFLDSKNNYFFNISPTDSISFDLWKADVEIYNSSYLNVAVIDGKFVPSAVLHGKMNIDTGTGDLPKLKLPDLAFEHLKLGNKAPFIEGGIFSPESVSSLPQVGSFKLDLEKIGVRKVSESEVAMDITTAILLNGQEGGAFSAAGGIQIVGQVENIGTRSKLKFSELRLTEAKINIDNGAYKFNGFIKHYHNDKTFGTGYSGLIDAEFKPGIGVKVKAMFGKAEGVNYWYADALARFTPAITVAPALGIFGFGGGASWHMSRKNIGETENSLSGTQYLPDPEAGLSIRAAVELGSLPDKSAFAGSASFELAFYNNGGMKNLNFRGEAIFMEPKILDDKVQSLANKVALMSKYQSNQHQPDDLYRVPVEGNASQINGDITINYDFGNRILHGTFQVFVNTPGGIIKGTGINGRAGWAVAHFAPDDWYVHIGTPQNRIGLKMGIGAIAATTNAYFMAGRNLPAPPLPSENVGKILGGINLDYMRDESSLSSGRGFALGAALEFNTGDLEFWKFYAKFHAGAGFDLMLKDYGPDVTCGNRSAPFGINGWYANGQAYAFFDGKIGIYVDLFGESQKFDIINLSAAAVLQAKLPNPFWMRGIVGGNFSVLNGLVSGSCKFEVTLGEECDLSNTSAVSGLQVIAAVTPDSGTEDVSVFTNPQAVFNLPVNKEFELLDPDNRKKKFRIKLDHFRIRSDNGVIIGDIEWNSTNDVAVIKPFEILPPETHVFADVQISYEENLNGSWIPVTTNGNIIIEQQNTEFVTGTAPDFIPLENVQYAYPTPKMQKLFSAESNQGYIQLIQGQKYLFEDQSYAQVGNLKSDSEELLFEYYYDDLQRRVSYTLPSMNALKTYDFSLKRVTNTDLDMDKNVSSQQNNIAGSTDITVTTKKVEGSIEVIDELMIYESSFSTSEFSTFADKLSGINFRYIYRDQLVDWDVHRIESGFVMTEEFSAEELNGSQYTEYEPLIRKSAIAEDNYFTQTINPLVYANYPINGVANISQRNIDDLGIIPVRAINLSNSFVQYDLPITYRQDFHEIRNKVIPLYINQPNPLPDQVHKLLFYSFPIVPQGVYKVKYEYFLPGQESPNSSYTQEIKLDFSN